ncbi:MAG: hypothetical protein QM632_00780 [Micrococcaceae bacterium]
MKPVDDFITKQEALSKHGLSENMLENYANDVRRKTVNGKTVYSESDIVSRDKRLTRQMMKNGRNSVGILSDEEWLEKYGKQKL